MKKTRRLVENLAIAAMVALALGIAILMDRRGMPQKWHAAIVGTIVTFGGIALVFQRKWANSSFWIAFGLCFAAHLIFIWIVFQWVFAPVQTLGILIWSPVAFVEGVLLLGIVPAVERHFRA